MSFQLRAEERHTPSSMFEIGLNAHFVADFHFLRNRSKAVNTKRQPKKWQENSYQWLWVFRGEIFYHILNSPVSRRIGHDDLMKGLGDCERAGKRDSTFDGNLSPVW